MSPTACVQPPGHMGWLDCPVHGEAVAASVRKLGRAEGAPSGQDEGLIPLNEAQLNATKQWAADDRLWTTQETVEINLRTFARVILRDATEVASLRADLARATQRAHDDEETARQLAFEAERLTDERDQALQRAQQSDERRSATLVRAITAEERIQALEAAQDRMRAVETAARECRAWLATREVSLLRSDPPVVALLAALNALGVPGEVGG